ncbi:YgaP family membrane protein [Spirosoma spitsbergense]|jgi:hypothetical protein|uniref:YgaP family membrane protein n=1 Tax=Spirosoma spitsbergense TaxID=431554 RepID=UPI000360E0C5|nr:DUF2892 domain-containing protein [Spirosoma spitsbergense]
MKTNMNGTDRIIRFIVALVAIVLYFTGILSGVAGIVALVVSGIFLLTSFVSFCPLYALLGIKTAPTKQ